MPDPDKPPETPPPSSWKAKLLAAGLICVGGGLSFAGGSMAARWQQAREERLAYEVAGEMLQAFEEAATEKNRPQFDQYGDRRPDREPDRLSNKVASGFRALVLPVDETIARTLRPDDRVDAILNFLAPVSEQSTERERVSAYLIESARILDVEEKFVTLELTLDEVQWAALALASASAQKVSFSPIEILPRNPHDEYYLKDVSPWKKQRLFDRESLIKIFKSNKKYFGFFPSPFACMRSIDTSEWGPQKKK